MVFKGVFAVVGEISPHFTHYRLNGFWHVQDVPARVSTSPRAARHNLVVSGTLGDIDSSSRNMMIRAAITEMSTGPINIPINPNT